MEEKKLLQGVHHVCLKAQGSRPYERAKEFYLRTLGFELVREWGEGDGRGCMIRLGYQDMMVQRSGSLYYWNLVNLGDGWYHVDCGRGSGAVTEPVFLMTDQELAKCSAEAGNGFYDFDSTLFPAASAR